MGKPSGKKVVFYSPFAIWPFHFEMDLELIWQHIQQGDDVLVLVCDGELGTCEPNLNHELLKCQQCIARRRNGFKLLGLTDKVRFKSFKNLTDADYTILKQYQKLDFKNMDDLKGLFFEKCDIGLAVASSLITVRKNPSPNICHEARYIKKNVWTALMVFLSLKNHFQAQRPDKLYLVNGRLATLRPALRAAQALGVNVMVSERAGIAGSYTLTEGTYPHDLENHKRIIAQTWKDSSLDDQKKAEIADQWFKERRAGKSQGWLSYTDKHKDMLPEGFDAGKINVVIFNSSEDEFAVMEGWENRIYKDQNMGILKIIEDLQSCPNVHIYLRVHPNLKRAKNSQTRFIERIKNSYSHLTVIGADSPVSTYKLMDAASFVITFGSTTGIEAAYNKKISLLAGRGDYEDLDACIQVKTHEELIGTIKGPEASLTDEIYEKRKFNALKYGFFMSAWGRPFKLFKQNDILDLTYNGFRIRHEMGIVEKIYYTLADRLNPFRNNRDQYN